MKNITSPFTGGNATLRTEKNQLTFRKEAFSYTYLFYECDATKQRFTTTELDEVNINQVYNQYRVKYGIPFPDEIKAIRGKYSLPASKMAEVLGFGDNQYRLYENGDMPSEANGKVLASIRNPYCFKEFVKNARHQLDDKEYSKILEKIENAQMQPKDTMVSNLIFGSCQRDETNGYASQSLLKLKNVLLFFIEKCNGVFCTKMNKLLFYVDFYSYRQYGVAITGLAYKAIQFGPVPLRWDRVYSLIDDVNQEIVYFDNGNYGQRLVSNMSCDLSVFSENEKDVLNAVLLRFKNVSAKEIADVSHDENAWKNYHFSDELIKFDEAFTLTAI